jgi:hypothetical protein
MRQEASAAIRWRGAEKNACHSGADDQEAGREFKRVPELVVRHLSVRAQNGAESTSASWVG